MRKKVFVRVASVLTGLLLMGTVGGCASSTTEKSLGIGSSQQSVSGPNFAFMAREFGKLTRTNFAQNSERLAAIKAQIPQGVIPENVWNSMARNGVLPTQLKQVWPAVEFLKTELADKKGFTDSDIRRTLIETYQVNPVEVQGYDRDMIDLARFAFREQLGVSAGLSPQFQQGLQAKLGEVLKAHDQQNPSSEAEIIISQVISAMTQQQLQVNTKLPRVSSAVRLQSVDDVIRQVQQGQ